MYHIRVQTVKKKKDTQSQMPGRVPTTSAFHKVQMKLLS